MKTVKDIQTTSPICDKCIWKDKCPYTDKSECIDIRSTNNNNYDTESNSINL